MMPPSGVPSLQERFAPASICYGCGPANPAGLHLRSFPDGDTVTAEWQPEARFQAFEGVLNGGIIGVLVDCHANWTAAWHLMRQGGLERAPATVTAEFSVKFRRPTPIKGPVRLTARVVESKPDRAIVEATLEADGVVCANGRGTFVAVKPDHPGYHRW